MTLASIKRYIFISLALLTPQFVNSEEINQEDEIRAAIIFKISWFVQWPGLIDKDVLICSFEKNTINTSFRKLVGLKSQGRNLSFKELKIKSAIPSLCSILYLTKKSKYFEKSSYKLLKNTLTISGSRGFADHGGMIEIGRKNEQMFFNINLHTVSKSNVILSSELLKLAVIKREHKNVK